MKALRFLAVMVLVPSVTGCAVNNSKYAATLRKANPRTILVLPALNETDVLSAPDYMIDTISEPLSELGYQVLPVSGAKNSLSKIGLNDVSAMHEAPTAQVAEKFNADAVMYMTIHKWSVDRPLLRIEYSSQVSYVLKDGHTGSLLWEADAFGSYNPSDSALGGIFTLVHEVAIATKEEHDDFAPLAKRTHDWAFMQLPHAGLPNR